MGNLDKQNPGQLPPAGRIHSVMMPGGSFSNTMLNDEELHAYLSSQNDADKRRAQLMTDKEIVLDADTNEEIIDHKA